MIGSQQRKTTEVAGSKLAPLTQIAEKARQAVPIKRIRTALPWLISYLGVYRSGKAFPPEGGGAAPVFVASDMRKPT